MTKPPGRPTKVQRQRKKPKRNATRHESCAPDYEKWKRAVIGGASFQHRRKVDQDQVVVLGSVLGSISADSRDAAKVKAFMVRVAREEGLVLIATPFPGKKDAYHLTLLNQPAAREEAA